MTGSRALYGGDVTAAAKLLTSLAKRMADGVSKFPDLGQRGALITELVNTAVDIGSNLLGAQGAAWADLRPAEYRNAATELLLGLEEVAFLLADNLHEEKIVPYSSANICKLRFYLFYNTFIFS